MASSTSTTRHRSVCVISGGTAGNEVLDAFTTVFDACAFVLPVSDNGGSSSEIIRVLGGPSLGDIRSRLVRLIPEAGDKQGIKALFAHRLPSSDDVDHATIKQEWLEIVEGSHPLWRDISPERREAIRAFCVHFEHAILRRAQRRFNYRSGSIGNFWLAGVQLFVRSLQSAIFLFSSVCGIPSQYSVIPAINTNSLVTIAAELEDGSRIVGQNGISHPSADSGAQIHHGSYTPASGHWTPVAQRSGASSRQAAFLPSIGAGSGSSAGAHAEDFDTDHDDSSGVLARTEHDLSLENDVDEGETSWDTPRRDEPRIHPASPTADGQRQRTSSAGSGSVGSGAARSAKSNIVFSKTEEGWPPLPARIARIIYLNTYGLETFPSPASAYVKSLQESQYLVYSCGSLFTSLIPPLALSGIGTTIALSQTLKAKILLLNGSFDRETEGLTAVDFIEAVTSHLNGSIRPSPQLAQSAGSSSSHLQPASFRRPNRFAPGDYVTHLVYLEKGSVPVDVAKLESMSIRCIAIAGDGEKENRFSGASLAEALRGVLNEA